MNSISAWIDGVRIRLLKRSPRMITWTWDTIKAFGSSKILKTSYIFLFLVPVLARALVSIPETVTVPILGKTIEIGLALPFSWILLFVSAFLASLGNVIYALRCPKIISEFSDFPSFQAAKRGGIYLRQPVRELVVNSDAMTIMGQLDSVRELYNNVPINLEELERTMNGYRDVSAAEFYFIRDAANLGLPISRLIASVTYFGAFACLTIIAIQNVACVFAYLCSVEAAD